MNWIGRFLSSSIGRKYVMSVTGLALVGFLIVHLAGNLALFESNESFNAYARKLEANPLLPVAEIGLAALFLVHASFAFWLIAGNRAARRTGYRSHPNHGARTLASTTMRITGPLILLYLAIHLWDFRVQKLFDEDYDLAAAVHDRLSSPWGATIYLAGVTVLGFHLWHGFQSAFLTLGVSHPRWRPLIHWTGRVLAVVIAVGFASFPVWIFMWGG